MKYLNKIITLFCKHETEPFFKEHTGWVHTSRCLKCKTQLGLPKWKLYDCPPPALDGAVVSNKEWNKFVDEKIETIRLSTAAKRKELGLKSQ